MGISIGCKKGASYDITCGGFLNFRLQVAKLANKEFGEQYERLTSTTFEMLSKEQKQAAYHDINEKVQALIDKKAVSPKIVDFCCQTDIDGAIRFGACKAILKAIGDYDDDYVYGYLARPPLVKWATLKNLLQECVDKRCDLVWD